MAKRVQLQRRKGWRIRGAAKVARPTRWGNPARILPNGNQGWIVQWGTDGGAVGTFPSKAEAHHFAVEGFRAALDREDGSLPFTRAQVRRDLRGLDLACWCPPDMECHADVLLEVANA